MSLRHPAYGALRPVTDRAQVLLAENPGPMTLDGTNTWILREPGAAEHVVVDPGPADKAHIARILGLGPAAAILLTHHHADHVRAAGELARRLSTPVWALSPEFLPKSWHVSSLQDGQTLELAGLRLQVLATPGHTADSTSFVLQDTTGSPEAVLTGDTILGRGSTVLTKGTGDLGDYLRSMRKLMAFAEGAAGQKIVGLPGHGPELGDVAQAARIGLSHRQQRLDQVRGALKRLGPKASSWKVTRSVYANVDLKLLPAAWSSTKVQLRYLKEAGEL